jgi:hypothetical protein
MHRIAFSVALLASVVAIIAQRPALADSAPPNGLHWGDPVAGLQMAVVPDLPAGAVHCWIRNAENHAVSFDQYYLQWEYNGIEVQDPTGSWTNLARTHLEMRIYEGVGTDGRWVEELPPHQVITNKGPDGFQERGPLFVPRSTGFPAPAKLGATLVLDLGDFQWPEQVLRQAVIEVRVMQDLRVPGMEAKDPEPGTSLTPTVVHSPVIQLDGAKMRSFLEGYRQKK